MAKTKPKPDDPIQFARFKQAAKDTEVGPDATEILDRAFRKIAPEKPIKR